MYLKRWLTNQPIITKLVLNHNQTGQFITSSLVLNSSSINRSYCNSNIPKQKVKGSKEEEEIQEIEYTATIKYNDDTIVSQQQRDIKKKEEEIENVTTATTVLTIEKNDIIESSIIKGDQDNREILSPINPFEYSVHTVEDALHLPGLSRSVGLETIYIAGSIHQHLKNSMTLLQSLIQENRMESSFALFQVMERYYVPISEECYGMMREKIQVAMAELAKFNNAIARETENPGSVPDHELYIPTVETFNTVLNYYTETDKLVPAFRIFFAMRQLGVKPNKHTYRSLVNASLRYEDIDLALFAFENMRHEKVILEEQFYERLFESCCNCVHNDGAVDLYHYLVQNFNLPTINRMAFLTTLGITTFMSWFKLPKSTRSGRGWVTSLQVSPSRFIFPPKHENHKLLEPNITQEIKDMLSSSNALNKTTDNPKGLLTLL